MRCAPRIGARADVNTQLSQPTKAPVAFQSSVCVPTALRTSQAIPAALRTLYSPRTPSHCHVFLKQSSAPAAGRQNGCSVSSRTYTTSKHCRGQQQGMCSHASGIWARNQIEPLQHLVKCCWPGRCLAKSALPHNNWCSAPHNWVQYPAASWPTHCRRGWPSTASVAAP